MQLVNGLCEYLLLDPQLWLESFMEMGLSVHMFFLSFRNLECCWGHMWSWIFWEKLCMVKKWSKWLRRGSFQLFENSCHQFLLKMFLNKKIIFNIFLSRPHVLGDFSSWVLAQTTLNTSDCRILWRNIFWLSHWTPAFRRKAVLWFQHCQYVSTSVGKNFFSKMAYRIFLKLLMKLGCLSCEKLMEPDFILGIMPKSTLKIGFSGFCKKVTPLMCRFFGFKSCTIMTFMILLKLYVWKKSDSQVKCKNALCQSDCRIFKLYYLKDYRRHKVNLLHAGTYLLKLQINNVILGGRGQACPK